MCDIVTPVHLFKDLFHKVRIEHIPIKYIEDSKEEIDQNIRVTSDDWKTEIKFYDEKTNTYCDFQWYFPLYNPCPDYQFNLNAPNHTCSEIVVPNYLIHFEEFVYGGSNINGGNSINITIYQPRTLEHDFIVEVVYYYELNSVSKYFWYSKGNKKTKYHVIHDREGNTQNDEQFWNFCKKYTKINVQLYKNNCMVTYIEKECKNNHIKKSLLMVTESEDYDPITEIEPSLYYHRIVENYTPTAICKTEKICKEGVYLYGSTIIIDAKTFKHLLLWQYKLGDYKDSMLCIINIHKIIYDISTSDIVYDVRGRFCVRRLSGNWNEFRLYEYPDIFINKLNTDVKYDIYFKKYNIVVLPIIQEYKKNRNEEELFFAMLTFNNCFLLTSSEQQITNEGSLILLQSHFNPNFATVLYMCSNKNIFVKITSSKNTFFGFTYQILLYKRSDNYIDTLLHARDKLHNLYIGHYDIFPEVQLRSPISKNIIKLYSEKEIIYQNNIFRYKKNEFMYTSDNFNVYIKGEKKKERHVTYNIPFMTPAYSSKGKEYINDNGEIDRRFKNIMALPDIDNDYITSWPNTDIDLDDDDEEKLNPDTKYIFHGHSRDISFIDKVEYKNDVHYTQLTIAMCVTPQKNVEDLLMSYKSLLRDIAPGEKIMGSKFINSFFTQEILTSTGTFKESKHFFEENLSGSKTMTEDFIKILEYSKKEMTELGNLVREREKNILYSKGLVFEGCDRYKKNYFDERVYKTSYEVEDYFGYFVDKKNCFRFFHPIMETKEFKSLHTEKQLDIVRELIIAFNEKQIREFKVQYKNITYIDLKFNVSEQKWITKELKQFPSECLVVQLYKTLLCLNDTDLIEFMNNHNVEKRKQKYLNIAALKEINECIKKYTNNVTDDIYSDDEDDDNSNRFMGHLPLNNEEYIIRDKQGLRHCTVELLVDNPCQITQGKIITYGKLTKIIKGWFTKKDKQETIDHISINKYDSKGKKESSLDIDKNNKLTVSTTIKKEEKKKQVYGYKLASTIEGYPCVIKLEILSDCKVVSDKRGFKHRASKVKVIWIRPARVDKGHVTYLKDYTYEKCHVCTIKFAHSLAIPCRHKCCEECWTEIIKHDMKCPYCRQQISKIFKLDNSSYKLKEEKEDNDSLDIAFSFIAGEMAYHKNEVIEIKDFNSDMTKPCAAGIHFHLNEDDLIPWFEFLDIPAELRHAPLVTHIDTLDTIPPVEVKKVLVEVKEVPPVEVKKVLVEVKDVQIISDTKDSIKNELTEVNIETIYTSPWFKEGEQLIKSDEDESAATTELTELTKLTKLIKSDKYDKSEK